MMRSSLFYILWLDRMQTSLYRFQIILHYANGTSSNSNSNSSSRLAVAAAEAAAAAAAAVFDSNCFCNPTPQKKKQRQCTKKYCNCRNLYGCTICITQNYLKSVQTGLPMV